MTFTYGRSYRGKIQAVLLDWAGTTMDYGCMAPAVVFVEVFKRQGVPITMEEARAPMGAHKRVHIQKISQLDTVRQRWQEAHGRLADRRRRRGACSPISCRCSSTCLSDYSELIPGTLEASPRSLRARGMKIGSTTGYMTRDDEDQPARRGEAGLRARFDRLRERRARRPPVSVHVPAERHQPRRLAGRGLRQGRRHRSRHRGRAERRHVDDRPRHHRQRDRAAAQGRCGARSGRARSGGASAPTRACTSAARTTSSTASPTSCRASTRSRRGSRAASDRRGAPPARSRGGRPGGARRRRQLAAGSPLLPAARACPLLLARNASAMSNAALVNFRTSANSSSDRRRAASLAR